MTTIPHRIMTTVCIIGAGELGGAVAQALARGWQVGRIALIDTAGNVASGKALDIQQSGAIEGFHTGLSGTDDFTRVTGCDVCVLADRVRSEEPRLNSSHSQISYAVFCLKKKSQESALAEEQ